MCSFPRAQAEALPRLHSALPSAFLSKMCPHCLYLIVLPKEKQAKARPFWPAQASCLWHRKGEKQSGIVKKHTFAEQECAAVTISQMKKLVTEGQATSPKSLYKSVQSQEKKTSLLPYATTFKLPDLLQKGFKTDSQIRLFWVIVTKLQKHLTVPPNLPWQKCGPKS